ncbi:MAG: energy-coupled thiamine transporter ThiT [Clostridiales bacterium]|jgi:thiamine transporter|nr:energy-coupled thiamine transporter ThiT [Clostridiales bacterium]
MDLKKNASVKTREVVIGAVCLSLSFLLYIFPIWRMPLGGDVTAGSALPLLLYSYFYGFRKSILYCCSFVLLQFVFGIFFINVWSILLDYVLPASFLCWPCVCNKNMSLSSEYHKHKGFFWGVVLYFLFRIFSHTLSGVIFWSNGIDFGIWQGDLVGGLAWSYSFMYNLLYLLPDTLIVIVLGFIILKNKHLTKVIKKDI